MSKDRRHDYRADLLMVFGVGLVALGCAQAWPPLCALWLGTAAIAVALRLAWQQARTREKE